eukprot:gene42794-52294_t
MGSSHRDSKKHAHKSEKEREKDHKSRDRGEGKERKERKSHKEHKSDRDHKSHKEKKEHKKHKRERDHRGDKARVAAPIGPDDFFLKNQEFRAWLWLTQRRRFEDLSSAEAHVEFAQRFCAQFNEGALDTFFYTGIAVCLGRWLLSHALSSIVLRHVVSGALPL